jgi:hypothetical protein
MWKCLQSYVLLSSDFYERLTQLGDTRWRSWLRHCATNRKVAGLVPDGVTGNFY